MSTVQEPLHQIAIAALAAVQEKVDRSQVNKLLEVLNAYDIETLIVFMARQVARGEFGKCAAQYLISIIEAVASEARKRNADVKAEVRKALGYFKWFFEVFSGVGSKALSGVMENYQTILTCGDRESVEKALASVKPETYLELLKAVLPLIGVKSRE